MRNTRAAANPGDDSQFQPRLRYRHRVGRLWRVAFLASTVIGVVVLSALLYNIVDGAFGYIAIANTIDPQTLALAVAEQQLLSTARVTALRAEDELARAIAGKSAGVGIIGYSTYLDHADSLALLFAVERSPSGVGAAAGLHSDVRVLRSDTGRPVDAPVDADAVAVVVSARSPITGALAQDQLEQTFTTAGLWSQLDPDLPSEPVERFLPLAGSSTLRLFLLATFDKQLADLPTDTLVGILRDNVSAGLFRRFESEKSWADRSQEEVLGLIVERVVEPEIVDTWSLTESVVHRSRVLRQAAEDYPDAEVAFHSWIKPQFVVNPQSADPERAGVRTAILGSLWTIAIAAGFSFLLGVGAAIYLEEYATDTWINRIIQTNINNLAGVPSIIYGMLGLAIFVRALEPLTSGSVLGLVDPTTSNGRTIFSAGLTLGLLVLPLIIINAQEAIKAVPLSLRQASYGLGATKWQTTWHHVLPGALPGILTGTILAISRAVGETAPLVVVGASTFITRDPSGPFSKFTTLPIQIYQWTSRPQDEFRNIAAAAIIVLLVLLLSLNAAAVLLRNRYARRI